MQIFPQRDASNPNQSLDSLKIIFIQRSATYFVQVSREELLGKYVKKAKFDLFI